MNLHRSNSKSDWESIDTKDRNVWQRMAAATAGVITPGNIATFIGIALVAMGLLEIIKENYWWGSALIIIGRLCDLLDGWLAESTQTKSPLGELLDASIDKLEILLTIVVFYTAMLAPWWLLTALLLPHIWIAIIAFLARRRGERLHPSRSGKISMALLWVVLFGYVLLRAFDMSDDIMALIMVNGLAAGSIVMSIETAIGYMSRKD